VNESESLTIQPHNFIERYILGTVLAHNVHHHPHTYSAVLHLCFIMSEDLNKFTVVQLKQQLTKHGESDLKGKKAVLVGRLQALIDNEGKSNENVTLQPTSSENVAPEEHAVVTETAPTVVLASTAKSTLTLKELKSFKVADLKKELKTRGLSVSGLKAVLQNRLAEAGGLSMDPTATVSAMPATKELPFKEIQNKVSDVQTSEVAPSAKPTTILKKQTTFKNVLTPTKKILTPTKASPSVSNDKSATKAQVCIALEKSTKVTFANTGDENALNGAVEEDQWKRVAPKDCGSETKLVDNLTFYWCAKCKSWKDSHGTSEHKKTPGKKRNNNKRSKPLTPSRPGGLPMGLAFTPPARLLANRKQTPGMNKKLLF
jgi:hypothetical protein